MKTQILFLFIIILGIHGYIPSMNNEQIHHLKEEVKDMFYHAYNNYMRYAFPKDELRPISCSGQDTWTNSSLTLIDTLDTLLVMGNKTEFVKGVKWVQENIKNFDKDLNVSVFETNIRIVGGLLSAHLLIINDPSIYKEYNNELLPLIVDLVDRLLLAFDTPTGIPFGTINLKKGVPINEVQITCTAGGGTFLLEFGLLSYLTGNPKYLDTAKKAIYALYERKSPIGLLGNHINIYNGLWTLKESGIGAGVDSYFEYLYKGYLLFGDEEYFKLFQEYHESIMKHLYKSPWFVDVDMNTGAIIWPIFNSLQAFYPGIMALHGQIKEAKETLSSFHSVWRKYGFVPEGFNIQSGTVQPGQLGYPLRPEIVESIYTLYKVTKDPTYLYMGRDIVYSLNNMTRVKCGFTNIANVQDKTQNDKMESFFLAETLKYLYLLFDENNFVNQNPYTFNTEGHLIPLRKEYLSKNGTFIYNTQCPLEKRDMFFDIQ